MLKRIFVMACLLALMSVYGTAQTPASPDAPSKEDVLRFLDLMQIRARMTQMMDGMKSGMKAGAEASLRQNLSNATPEQLAKADALTDTIFKDFPINEMIDAMVPIYQRHLAKADLDAVIAFYDSPAGRKLLKEQPAMMSEGMKAGQDIMMKKIPEITQRMKTEIDRLAKAEASKGSSVRHN